MLSVNVLNACIRHTATVMKNSAQRHEWTRSPVARGVCASQSTDLNIMYSVWDHANRHKTLRQIKPTLYLPSA